MTHEQFESLVAQLEVYARREPQAYTTRVGLLAALGYGYLFLVVAVLLGIVIALVRYMILGGHFNIVEMKVGFFLLVPVYYIVRSLSVSIPPPEGMPLRPEATPKLFEALDDICRTLNAPRFHHVLLTEDFNAGVVQVPKLGIFGWQVNYLLLGLPLMYALTPDQFRAVVAHEVGHLSGNHSRFSGWIYRVRLTWTQILENLQKSGHKSKFVFESFLDWYAPYFNAYTFVLARNQEYIADQCAVEIVGSKVSAEALINSRLKGQFLHNEYWPEIFKGVKVSDSPPPAVYASMLNSLREYDDTEKIHQWYTEALSRTTDFGDTHPSLADRLKALGYESTPAGSQTAVSHPLPAPGPTTQTAADAFLGSQAAWYSDRFGQEWREAIRGSWMQAFIENKEARDILEKLNLKKETETLSLEEQWQRVSSITKLEDREAAYPILQEILAEHPDNVYANFSIGQILLDRNEAQGIAILERAMKLDSDCTISACKVLYRYATRNNMTEEALRYRRRAENFQR